MSKAFQLQGLQARQQDQQSQKRFAVQRCAIGDEYSDDACGHGDGAKKFSRPFELVAVQIINVSPTRETENQYPWRQRKGMGRQRNCQRRQYQWDLLCFNTHRNRPQFRKWPAASDMNEGGLCRSPGQCFSREASVRNEDLCDAPS